MIETKIANQECEYLES